MKLGLLSGLTNTKEEDALLIKRLGDSYLSGPQQLFKRFTFLLSEAGTAREQEKKEGVPYKNAKVLFTMSESYNSVKEVTLTFQE